MFIEISDLARQALGISQTCSQASYSANSLRKSPNQSFFRSCCLEHPGVAPPCWRFPSRGPQPSEPASPTPSRTPQNATCVPLCFLVCQPVVSLCRPPSPPSPPLPSSHMPPLRTFLPFGLGSWGAGGEGAGSGARPGAAAEGQTPFGDLLVPSQGSEAENTTRAQPTLSSSTRRISCAVRMSARRKLDTIFRIKASGYSLSLPWFVDAPRYLHGAAQDAQLLLLAFAAQMLHQVTQREVRARVITEHQCRCGELGRGSWPHLWSPPTPLLACGVALADQPL